MMKIINTKRQKGFTVVELMIATVIFSLVLLIAMVALINMSKLYYKGITNSKTQEQARSALAEISQSIQYSRQEVTYTPIAIIPATYPDIPLVDPLSTEISSTTGFFCVGPRRYSFVIDRKLSLKPDTDIVALAVRKKERRHVLWVDTPLIGCAGKILGPADLTKEDPCDTTALIPCSNGIELMSENMRLTGLTLSEVTPNSDLWTITLGVAYGDDDLLDEISGRYECLETQSVSEFCGISELSTTVSRRL